MTFYISYNIEFNRTLSGIILENRQTIPETIDKTGFEVKAFIDSQIALVDDTVIPYIIETNYGNLAAFFSIKVVGAVGSVLQIFIRGNFAQFEAEIQQKINNFTISNDWRTDIL